MKKVKLKIDYTEACQFLRWLKYGIVANITSDFRYKGMVQASAAEVMHKLSVLTIFGWQKKKTITLTYTQALSVTLISPDAQSEYGKFVTSKIIGEIYDQIFRATPELLPKIDR